MAHQDQLPVAYSEYDRAVLSLVRSLPNRWSDINFDRLTEAEQHALLRVAIADLCMLRVRVLVTCNRGKAVVLCDIGGCYADELESAVVQSLPPDWRDETCLVQPDEPVAVRGTNALEAVKRSVDGGGAKSVLAWIEKAVAPARVRVKSCTTDGHDPGGRHLSLAAAQASTGDISIHVTPTIQVQMPEPTPVAARTGESPVGGYGSPQPPATIALTATEAATYIGLSPRQMSNWIRDHRIHAEPVDGGRYQFDKWELDFHRDVIGKRKDSQDA